MNRLAILGLVGLFPLSGCARQAGIPTGAEDVESVSAEQTPKGEKPSLMSLPDFYEGGNGYRCDPYIRAAVRLQSLGREAALKALKELVREEGEGKRAIILCRMLFAKRPGGEFRRPLLGGAVFLGGTSYSDWPLEPIEVVDGVPFLIVKGYILLGHAESSERYLDYCIADCVWNRVPFESKTPAETAKALAKLIHAAKWKRPLRDGERTYMADQVK
jgi:hypothetical protein